MTAISTTSFDDDACAAEPGFALRSDTWLLEAVADGSCRALEEVYRRYSSNMLKAAARLRGSHDADDIVQEVFLRLWDRPARFDPARGPLRGYLVMQTRSRAIDAIRADAARRSREDREPVEPRPASRSAEETALERAEARVTWTLLDRLSDAERDVIALAYFGSRTYREVAVILGEPEGTVKSRIRSGLRRLREVAIATQDPEDRAAWQTPEAASPSSSTALAGARNATTLQT